MPWGPGLSRQALLGEERPAQPGVAGCCSGTRLQPPVCEPSPAPSPFSLDGHGERRDPTHGAVRALPGLRGLPGPARRCRRPSGSRAVLRHGRLRADGRRVGLHLLPQAPRPPRAPPGAGPRAVHDRLPSQVRSSPASQPASATLRAPPQAAGEGGGPSHEQGAPLSPASLRKGVLPSLQARSHLSASADPLTAALRLGVWNPDVCGVCLCRSKLTAGETGCRTRNTLVAPPHREPARNPGAR